VASAIFIFCFNRRGQQNDIFCNKNRNADAINSNLLVIPAGCIAVNYFYFPPKSQNKYSGREEFFRRRTLMRVNQIPPNAE